MTNFKRKPLKTDVIGVNIIAMIILLTIFMFGSFFFKQISRHTPCLELNKISKHIVLLMLLCTNHCHDLVTEFAKFYQIKVIHVHDKDTGWAQI